MNFPLHVNDLVQNCSNSIASALELLQFCTKTSMWMTFSVLQWNCTHLVVPWCVLCVHTLSSALPAWTRGCPLKNTPYNFNSCAEFISGSTKIYLHLLWFLNTEMAQVLDIISHGRQGHMYTVESILGLLMPWWHEEPYGVDLLLFSAPVC